MVAFSALSTRARTTVGPQRSMRLVVRAQGNAAQSVAKAIKDVPAVVKPALTVAVANALMAMPAAAEAGKLFDFDLTLPVMTAQFLLLMVFLDKFWFGPVGRVLDERDSLIREKLASVGDNSAELKRLQEEAEAVLKAARTEAAANIAETKKRVEAEQNEKLAVLKANIDKELEAAIAALEKEREAALSSLDSQVDKLSSEILERVLPAGTKL